MRGLVECGRSSGRAAMTDLGRDVARRRGPYERRTLGDGIDDIGDHRQRVVTDVDSLRRLTRLFGALCDHCGDGFADEAHRADRERVPRRRRARRPVRALEVRRRRQRLHLRANEIVAGDDREHARQRCGGGGVDAENPRVRIRRSQKRNMRLPWRGYVVGKDSRSGEKPLVLDAQHRLPAAKPSVFRGSHLQSLSQAYDPSTSLPWA